MIQSIITNINAEGWGGGGGAGGGLSEKYKSGLV